MKKFLLLSVICFLAVSAASAQSQIPSPLPQMDSAVKVLAGGINKSLSQERVAKISVNRFTYRDTIPPLGYYWANQLGEELTGLPNKTFTVLSDGTAGADILVSGEIVEVGNTVRVYTRLIRTGDRSIAAVFHSDFERNPYLAEMLSGGGSRSSGGTMIDSREPDSWDYPVPAEIGTDANTPGIARTIHNEDDEDFFILLPAQAGRLVVQTTGSMDTMMELYDADTREELEENDDGASGSNARIRYSVQAGKRYMAKVEGYSDNTGQYHFQAYLSGEAAVVPDEYESDDDFSSAKLITVGTPQQHSFHHGDDEDWVKFEIASAGRYVIRARGVQSTQLDTRVELFDSDRDSIAEDDDGGRNYDSRLSHYLESGLYYLKVDCLDDDPEEPYTISIEAASENSR